MIKKILIAIALFAVGVVLVIYSGKLKEQLNDPSLVKTQAAIVDIVLEGSGEDTTHTVYVEYELDGVTKKAQLDSYSSGMRIGDTQEILVDAGDPTYVRANSPTSSRIMLGLGIACFVFGLLSLFSKARRV